GVSWELADTTDAPGAEVVERPGLRSLDLDAARPPRSGVPNPANHLFSNRPSVDCHAHVLVDAVKDGLDVTAREGVVAADRDLHVLLRHRLFPQSGGFAGLR